MSTTSRATNPSYELQISDITIRAQKPLKSVEVLIDKAQREASWDRTDAQVHQANFTPSLDLRFSSALTLRLHPLREPFSLSTWKAQNITIDTQDLQHDQPHGEGHRQEWRRFFGGTEIIVGLSSSGRIVDQETVVAMNQGVTNYDSEQGSDHQSAPLPSTIDDIIRICPRFRILVIGKSGVGKSSVINSAFGVDKASVSHVEAGKSNINTEILSDKNDKFILHDSQGFEPGEVGNFGTVRDFIKRRNNMPHIKDRLHAIWLCFEIPRAGGRIFETGVENFLKSKANDELGKIPVIAVFTKYDKLIARAKRNMDTSRRAGLDPDRIFELAKGDADTFLHDNCIGPFEEIVQEKVPHMTVSTMKGYEDSLSKLIELTYNHVREHVAKEPSIISAIAQKVSPGVKIDGSIAVGRTKYWAGLASSVSFPGKTLENCLGVIHHDIVELWNFDDSYRLLYSREFRALMSHMVDDLHDRSAPNPNRGLSVGLSMVGAIAGIVSALAGPAAPIVMPIAGCFVLAKWAYDVYQQSHSTLRRLMAYIVDLTLIMQNLFWLVTIYRVPVSRRLVKIASKGYEQSNIKVQVHVEIEKHVQEANFFDRVHRDSALGKIVELINCNRINTAEMFELKDKIGDIDTLGKDDEPWDVSASEASGSSQ